MNSLHVTPATLLTEQSNEEEGQLLQFDKQLVLLPQSGLSNQTDCEESPELQYQFIHNYNHPVFDMIHAMHENKFENKLASNVPGCLHENKFAY